MFTVEEIWEEQERQYNQLMEEDDQVWLFESNHFWKEDDQ